MKIYTIIAGVNGVGKSSLTGVLRGSDIPLGRIIDVNRITAKCGGDKMTGGKRAVSMLEDCLQCGVSFTQETTLSGKKTKKTAARAKALGYEIRLYYVGLNSAEESLSRIANRVRKGGHNIAPEDVKRRFAARFESLLDVLPYCDTAQFYDNENGFVLVGEYRDGRIQAFANPPVWMAELAERVEGFFPAG